MIYGTILVYGNEELVKQRHSYWKSWYRVILNAFVEILGRMLHNN